MTTAEYVRDFVLPAAFAFLPVEMNTNDARVMLLAIGLQESRFEHRHQIGGPAVGFWQFEAGGGIKGVLDHPQTKPIMASVLDTMLYAREDCYEAIQHNDALACIFARLLLWTHPGPLPRDAASAWGYYLATWRPGKPHAATWAGLYHEAAGLIG